MTSEATKRPWLAALLAAILTGLGHVYLRRWRRAVGWFVLITLTVFIFVPGEVWDAAMIDLALVLMVSGMSILDAFLLARDHNRQVSMQRRQRCPSCRREREVEAAFCWYCATPFPDADATTGERTTDTDE